MSTKDIIVLTPIRGPDIIFEAQQAFAIDLGSYDCRSFWLEGSDEIYKTEADSLIAVIGTLKRCHPCVIGQKRKSVKKVFQETLESLPQLKILSLVKQ